MASYVLDTLGATGVRQAVVVTAADSDRVAKRLLNDAPDFPLRFIEHDSEGGTAAAAVVGVNDFDDFDDDEDLIIVPGDLPLLRPSTLQALVEQHRYSKAACTVLTVPVDHEMFGSVAQSTLGQIAGSRSFGLVSRDKRGRMSGIATGDEFAEVLKPNYLPLSEDDAIPEVALGVYCIRRGLLAPAARRCADADFDGSGDVSGIVGVLAESGHSCVTAPVSNPEDLVPVDDRLQLADAEAELRRRTNRHWLAMGVTMVDPDRTYIDVTVRLGTDITIFPGTILQGATTIGSGCELGPDTRLDQCTVGNDCRIEKTTASLSSIGNDCIVGPYAALEPGAQLPNGTVTGAFYAGG